MARKFLYIPCADPRIAFWMARSFEAEFDLQPEDYFCQPLPGGPRLIVLNWDIITQDPIFQFYGGLRFTDVGFGGHENCHFYSDMRGIWAGNREAERQHHAKDLNGAAAIIKTQWPWVERFHLRYATVTADRTKIAAVEKVPVL